MTAFEGQVDSVHLKTEVGEMEILPGHATIVGLIGFSRVFLRSGSSQQEFLARQGSVSVDAHGAVRLLAQDVQEAEAISVDSLKSYLGYLEELMGGVRELNAYQTRFLQEQRSALEESIKVVS